MLCGTPPSSSLTAACLPQPSTSGRKRALGFATRGFRPPSVNFYLLGGFQKRARGGRAEARSRKFCCTFDWLSIDVWLLFSVEIRDSSHLFVQFVRLFAPFIGSFAFAPKFIRFQPPSRLSERPHRTDGRTRTSEQKPTVVHNVAGRSRAFPLVRSSLHPSHSSLCSRYSTLDAFYIEPRTKDGAVASDEYLFIDKASNEIGTSSSSSPPSSFISRLLAATIENPIPSLNAEVRPIFGLWGIIPLIAGNYLLVITKAEVIGTLNGHDIYHVLESDVIPYQKSTLHLTQRQTWYNNCYLDMLRTVLGMNGFYYSCSYDLSRSLQYLGENASPEFANQSLYDRAHNLLCWNAHLLMPLARQVELHDYCLPIIHGFVGIRQCNIQGRPFKLVLISRRPTERPGVRFMTRGTDHQGAVANFVETEQIVEVDDGSRDSRRWTAFLQVRGSIPLLWSQKPNLKWQPQPYMRPQDDQLEAYVRHMEFLRQRYNGNCVVVNLVNQRGREHRLGSELARVVLQASLDYVKYVPFDFHAECKGLDWSALAQLRRTLDPDLRDFGFFSSSIQRPSESRFQLGYFRTNCMDCLDRTNVAQAMIAKESLRLQLIHLGVVPESVGNLDDYPEFAFVFRNRSFVGCIQSMELAFSVGGQRRRDQQAVLGHRRVEGTHSLFVPFDSIDRLQTDYTRFGERTMQGAVQDGINALTRYFKNNFTDGHKLDAMHLFLGCFSPSPHELPEALEEAAISFNANGAAVAGAVFSVSMMFLCVLVSENITATVFWFVIFFAFASFIILNGEEFVRKPKLKKD
ncbi:SAC domain-containing protein [Aphelenchoides fujianensis]|nr:SAC domain-containing protein [Aphelenchoides fujianensis]